MKLFAEPRTGVLVASIAVFAFTHLPAVASPKDRVGEKLEDATLRDLDGKDVKLLSLHDAKVLVVAYTGLGCPISGRYAPRLEEIAKKNAEKGVRVVGINANPQDTLEAIAKETKELAITFPVLQDHKQVLTRKLDATTTTEVFVIDSDRIIRYRGMIDDQYAVGEKRATPKTRYLERAIEAALRGQFPHVKRTAAPGCLITRVAPKKDEKPAEAKITYASHVAKIIQNNCTRCHRAEGVGPFPLTTYEQVTGWSAMIHSVVKKGRMPPWNAAPEFHGVFENERILSDADKDTLLAWIKADMPRGDPKDEPPAQKWFKGWRIGKPDRVYTMKEAFLVPKDGVVPYKFFMIPTDFKEDKWITAMEAKPGSPEVVHHMVAFATDPKKKNAMSAQLGLDEGFLCATVPGDTPSIFPEGCAKKLPAGWTLVLQMHYTTTGKAMRDKSSIGIKFASKRPAREVRTRGIYNLKFEVPAGDANFEVRSDYTIDTEVEVLSLFPHMHFRGKDWTYLAKLPDSTTKTVLSVPKYNFNWQESYILKQPLRLPAGTQLECIAHYDNSAQNFNNPDPKSPVRWGEQTWEEMMIGYIDYVPAAPSKTVGTVINRP